MEVSFRSLGALKIMIFYSLVAKIIERFAGTRRPASHTVILM